MEVNSEAKLFGKYVSGKPVGDAVIKKYSQATSSSPLGHRDEKLLKIMLKHRWAIGVIDCGLGLVDPFSEIRRRLHLMFAITETQPELSNQFLSRGHNKLYFFVIAWRAVVGVFKGLLGVIFIKVFA